MASRSRRKRSKAVTASELAQMGVCERLVLFEHRYGMRSTARRRAAIERGLRAHQRFYTEGTCLSQTEGWWPYLLRTVYVVLRPIKWIIRLLGISTGRKKCGRD